MFPFSFLLFSLALFAFWLRSSVVSVLFSLISETSLRTHSRLFLFLESARRPLGLPIVSGQSVVGIALPPADANTIFTFSSDGLAAYAGRWRRRHSHSASSASILGQRLAHGRRCHHLLDRSVGSFVCLQGSWSIISYDTPAHTRPTKPAGNFFSHATER